VISCHLRQVFHLCLPGMVCFRDFLVLRRMRLFHGFRRHLYIAVAIAVLGQEGNVLVIFKEQWHV